MQPNIINPTPRHIRALKCPPGKKQCYERISQDLHLYVSVTPGGSKSFVYRRYLNNTYRELHLELKFADSLDDAMAREVIKEAESRAAELHARINRGENPFDEAIAAKKALTVRELFNEYMERHVKKSRKQVTETNDNFERWFSKLAHRRAASVTRHDAEKFHGEMNKERGPYAANRAVQLGRAVYKKAIKWKLIANDNPFSSLSLFDEHSRDRFLSAEEAGKLIQVLKDVPEKNDDFRALRDFILLSMFTGARKTTVLSMRWDEIKDGMWHIPDAKSKNKSGQVIPLSANELAILNDRRNMFKTEGIIGGSVFPGTGSYGYLRDIKRSWTSLRKQTGLQDCTVHDLRRSLASAMASNNTNLSLIKSALNHRDLKTTAKVYAKVNKAAELEARELAHATWFKAANLLPKEKITNMQARRKSRA